MNDARTYLQIEYLHDEGCSSEVWKAAQEAPAINKDYASEDDEEIWSSYVDYLNLSRRWKYRLTRVRVITERDVIHV